MSITPHSLGATENFWNELYSRFIGTEGLMNFVYPDTRGVPTFGIGYALVIYNNAKKEWEIRANLDNQLSRINESLDADDKAVLDKIITALNSGNTTEATNLVNDHLWKCDNITDDQAKQLLKISIEDEYAGYLKNKIGTTLYDYFANSQEMVALLSITYQNPSAIKQPLIDALSNGNRAEAWYQIRYAMNTSDAGWMANRRYNEANFFSLYNDPNNVTDAEAKEVMRMYTRYETENTGYTMSEYETSYLPPSGIAGIDDSVAKAHDYLITNFASGTTIDGQVIVGAGLDSYAKIDKATDDRILGTDKNDLIFGEKGNDVLNGASGADTIYGGEGNDIIYGGLGNDTLYGESGNDIYIINAGDGSDTIEDKQGENKIIVNGEIIKLLIKQADGSYKNPDGKITATVQGTDLVVTYAATGEKITLNKDFTEGDFGIDLIDAPTDPVTNYTITGDLNPELDASGNPKVDAWGNIISDGTSSPNRNDTIYDTTGNDRIEGKGGNDTIYAFRGGDDRILGGDGNDTIGAWAGNDLIEGGQGQDSIWGGDGNDQIFGENKQDMATLVTQGETAQSLNQTGDYLVGEAGDDFIYGGDAKDTIYGGQGNDMLIGGGGDDYIQGDDTEAEAGNDYIQGGTGNDTILGMSGADTIMGGAGNDWLQGDDGNDYIDGGDGDDTILGGDGDDSNFFAILFYTTNPIKKHLYEWPVDRNEIIMLWRCFQLLPIGLNGKWWAQPTLPNIFEPIVDC